MKKLFILTMIVMLVACMGFAVSANEIANAMSVGNDEFDTVFWKNISELYESDGATLNVSADKELVYDIDLNTLGFIYKFYANGEQGFAIIIKTNGSIEPIEFFFDSEDPYESIPDTAKRVFVSTMTYLYFDNEDYYVVNSNDPLSDQSVFALRDVAFYSDDTIYGSYSEYVYFTGRTETKNELAKKHPGLYEVSGLSSACAPIAGGNLIMYWDRYKPDLIENYTPGTTVGSFYLYKERSATTDAVITQLYSDMGTTSLGTSIAQFTGGISTYCVRQGYTSTFYSCMTNGSFNFTTAKQKIDAGQPIVLFLDTYSVSEIENDDDYDYITYITGSGTHVMAGFGYKEVSYSLSGGGTRSDSYIAVGSGISLRKRGFFNIAYNTQIDDAYSLLIS